MLLTNLKVSRCSRQEITDFIEKHHYSGNINGCITDFCYKLTHQDTIVGAMFFGRMAMANQYKRFANSEQDVIELRRLCCIDDTPKNTESYFIGRALRLLKKDWPGKIVVSYADKEYGHKGTIYKASNFKQLEDIPGAKVIINSEGKRYHDKAIRTKYKGELKPFAAKLKKELDEGKAYYKTTEGKHTYVYNIR